MYAYFDCSLRSKTDLIGFQSPAKNSIKVTFHALVPLPLWDWDATSCMHIQFGRMWLGTWEHDCGDMTVNRYLNSLLNPCLHPCIHTEINAELLYFVDS